MSNKAETGMTTSSESEVMFLAAQARIAAIPAGETLIDSISDKEWNDGDVSTWMINAGSDNTGCSEELDESDREAMRVA